VWGLHWYLPFHISTDGLDTTIRATLGQNKEYRPYSIHYISKNLTLAKQNYTITKKEFFVVVHVIIKFNHYITSYLVFIHNNHFVIFYLINKPITNGRVITWLFLLQEFDITILDKLGKKNIADDFLSRLTNEGDVILFKDTFLDEHLFSLSINIPCLQTLLTI